MPTNENVYVGGKGRRLGRSMASRYDKKRLTVFDTAIAKALAAVPAPPSTISAARTKFTKGLVWPMMGNDEWGDCTVAGAGHTIQYLTTYEKHATVPADQDVVDEYLKLSGGVDSGLTLLDVLRPWQNEGLFDGHKLAAYAEIPSDPSVKLADWKRALRQSVWLAGSAYLAFSLPAGLQQHEYDWTKVGTGAAWRAGSWGGHCVPAVLYDAKTWYVVSWGKLVPVSDAFMAAYCDERWMPVSSDWVNAHGNTPNGRPLQVIVDCAKKIAG